MSSDQVNIDFEPQLFNVESKTSFNVEFEYIYFFFNGNNLKNARNYPKDYLDYLKTLGLEIPNFSPDDPNPFNWWGEVSEKSRTLNSKITALEIAQQNGLCPLGVRLVNNIEEVEKILIDNPEKDFFIRDPYLAAGNNSSILSQNKFNKKFVSKLLSKRAMIMAPYFNRLMDIGTIFEKGKIEFLWNLNSRDGKFKGGIIYKNDEDLFSFIDKKWGIKNEEILESQNRVYNLYLSRGAQGIIQIDSFLYIEDGIVKYYPLVEVNYRKSFGLFINRLKPFLTESGVGMFLSFLTKDLIQCDSFTTRLKQLEDMKYLDGLGVIPLSPQDGIFSSFFIAGESLSKVNENAKKLWSQISLGGWPLSPSLILDQFIL